MTDTAGTGRAASGPGTGPGLAGWRVLVTRAEHQAGELSRLIREAGGEPVELPVIAISPSPEPERLDAALARLEQYDWVIFTSANAVDAVVRRMAELGIPARALERPRLAAIGPATAAALSRQGLAVDVVPAEYVAEAVVKSLSGAAQWAGLRVLLPRAARARPVLPEGLRALGANVDVVAAYETVPADAPEAPAVLEQLAQGRIQAMTFTSPSTVEGFCRLLAARGREGRAVSEALASGTVIGCIGPVTAAAARERGFEVDVIAEEYTVAGLVRALAAYRQKGAMGRGVS
ncbi:MAG: uroporphyrinogen-III synthase [Firmicutes bacterium]|nr:uroporphyrinogen-III synthase [Bacillota bacterium]